MGFKTGGFGRFLSPAKSIECFNHCIFKTPIEITANLPFVPFELVGVTDLDNGVDGFSSIFLFDGVDAFDDVPDRGECGPNRSG